MMWYDHAREIQWKHVKGHNNSASKFSGFEHLSTSFRGSPKCSIHFKLAVFFLELFFFVVRVESTCFFPVPRSFHGELVLPQELKAAPQPEAKRRRFKQALRCDVQSCKVEGQSCIFVWSRAVSKSLAKRCETLIFFEIYYNSLHHTYHFGTLLSPWWTVCLKFSSCEAEDAPRLPLQEIRQARTNRTKTTCAMGPWAMQPLVYSLHRPPARALRYENPWFRSVGCVVWILSFHSQAVWAIWGIVRMVKNEGRKGRTGPRWGPQAHPARGRNRPRAKPGRLRSVRNALGLCS